ncbi:hypothetical protein [Nocardia nova]|uniref:DUF4254 domain-containing protein n=1 Tax=Nocardia nova SH22a TaxID=1415166 RepID=W5TLT2_9NOCA|nr:hypothetical protein [Nocardia nova]AHH20310.1 hypothetical protein NONO_c55300 [Nocardia nova SH22a]
MTTSIASALPAAPQLLCAFQGRRFQDRELLRAARALAELHARRAQLADPILLAEIDCRRSELIDDINEWVDNELPGYRRGLALRTDILGPMVDRMAGSWVAANRAIDRDGARSDTTHKHWYHLAELVDGYTDLVSGVVASVSR